MHELGYLLVMEKLNDREAYQMTNDDKIIYSLLVLVSFTLSGMFIGSWRMILYPYLLVIGLSILIGLLKSIRMNPKLIYVPIGVSIVYILLYAGLDLIMFGDVVSETNYIVGLTPGMAVYLLLIWPFSNLICLLYASTFTYEKPARSQL